MGLSLALISTVHSMNVPINATFNQTGLRSASVLPTPTALASDIHLSSVSTQVLLTPTTQLVDIPLSTQLSTLDEPMLPTPSVHHVLPRNPIADRLKKITKQFTRVEDEINKSGPKVKDFVPKHRGIDDLGNGPLHQLGRLEGWLIDMEQWINTIGIQIDGQRIKPLTHSKFSQTMESRMANLEKSIKQLKNWADILEFKISNDHLSDDDGEIEPEHDYEEAARIENELDSAGMENDSPAAPPASIPQAPPAPIPPPRQPPRPPKPVKPEPYKPNLDPIPEDSKPPLDYIPEESEIPESNGANPAGHAPDPAVDDVGTNIAAINTAMAAITAQKGLTSEIADTLMRRPVMEAAQPIQKL